MKKNKEISSQTFKAGTVVGYDEELMTAIKKLIDLKSRVEVVKFSVYENNSSCVTIRIFDETDIRDPK